MYKFVKSTNGLASFTIVFNGAGLFEGPGTYGYSHLIEHLVAGKLKKYENKFQEWGVSYNAATGNNRIFYFIKGLDEGVCKFKKTLLEIVYNGTKDLTKEELDAEKEIVKSEYEMSLMHPLGAHLELLGRKKFNVVNPLGTMEDIENATVESIQKFETLECQVYPACIIDVSSKPISKWPSEIERVWMPTCVEEYDDCDRYYFGFEKDMPTDDFCTTYWANNTSIVASFKIGFDEMPYIGLLSDVLGAGLSSPLYNEIRIKRNLAYAVHSMVYPIAKNIGIFLVAVTVNKDKVAETKEAIKEVLKNPKKYIKFSRFKSVCKGIQAADKIAQIRIDEEAFCLIDRNNSVEELIETNEINEIFMDKCIKVFKKVVKNVNKNIDVYNGNKKYK